MNKCQNCQNSFEITKQDKKYYQSFKVPEPTWCPNCRNQRRLSMRNERTFYERTCDCCQKKIIAYYPADAGQVVYCPECWYSDKWTPFDYGRNFDFSREFFPQFKEMYKRVPTLSLDIVNCENSNYVSYCGDDKSCYFDIAGEANENCLYGKFIKFCKDCVDNSFTYNSELCYECVNCHNCYGSTWLDRCSDCDHCHSCFDLKGCSHCINCSNLRNKKYCINNKEVSKDEFNKKIGSGCHHIRLKPIVKSSYQTNSENCTGNDITNSKNCPDCFDVVNCENSKWLWDVLDAKDCYDLNFSLYKPEHSLELISTLNMVESKFCNASHYCHHMEYCDKCNNSHDCFGSIGIMKGEYVILNKKYSESEYSTLKDKIIKHMIRTGEYGQFFPQGTSGFKYHETVASEYYFESGHHHARHHDTRLQDSLPVCQDCKRQFKIISQEKEFYNRLDLPEPKLCPECRHKNRNLRAGERNLYDRKCADCGIKLITPYPKGQIYCDGCYNKKIY
ncbi:zinc-ribbon domain-containing protein [Patescibacteria group bacterium]|nr:zinc-ribbon domain-containing protein [Patescibacteria group bacterium]MBU1673699.1 zinc-ribbon domain-containing protein [Patescibacteria group bacterium]MBU1963072.1 zinc-ribbon domain-containing protein [Patescibacteria group bacterium]